MESMKVKDLMVPLDQYVCVSEEATITDAILALEEAQAKYGSRVYPYRAVLVCDKDNKVIGKVGHLDVLRSLEPRYSEVGDLKKVSGFGLSAEFMRSMMAEYELWKAPLEDLCRKAAQVKPGKHRGSSLGGRVDRQDATLDQGRAPTDHGTSSISAGHFRRPHRRHPEAYRRVQGSQRQNKGLQDLRRPTLGRVQGGSFS